ncbi:Coactosin-like protein [Geodia barretti]|uniref:Coactosin-like protein n=1 Tax=Geodia barretti TaxID=519541 RepID=A0AA35T0S4_GEOBA|nr:Coactosin-like protein [Geodia barretti]
MSVFEDSGEAAQTAYEEVRSDDNETMWCALQYDGKKLEVSCTGTDYSELLGLMGDDERVYAYVRFETGDEMSRRAKFAFITWIGPSVSPLKKAKVSTDKAFVKAVWPNFGKEILADEKSELKQEKILKILEAASGAAYGTGK